MASKRWASSHCGQNLPGIPRWTVSICSPSDSGEATSLRLSGRYCPVCVVLECWFLLLTVLSLNLSSIFRQMPFIDFVFLLCFGFEAPVCLLRTVPCCIIHSVKSWSPVFDHQNVTRSPLFQLSWCHSDFHYHPLTVIPVHNLIVKSEFSFWDQSQVLMDPWRRLTLARKNQKEHKLGFPI